MKYLEEFDNDKIDNSKILLNEIQKGGQPNISFNIIENNGFKKVHLNLEFELEEKNINVDFNISKKEFLKVADKLKK